MNKKKLLSSKLTIILLLVAAGFFGRLKFKQYQQNKLVEVEKQKLASQIQSLQKKNKEIADSLEYFKSSGFKERVAREQLNLKKQDEQVFSFKEEVLGVKIEAVDSKQQLSKPEKWIQYFTGK